MKNILYIIVIAFTLFSCKTMSLKKKLKPQKYQFMFGIHFQKNLLMKI